MASCSRPPMSAATAWQKSSVLRAIARHPRSAGVRRRRRTPDTTALQGSAVPSAAPQRSDDCDHARLRQRTRHQFCYLGGCPLARLPHASRCAERSACLGSLRRAHGRSPAATAGEFSAAAADIFAMLTSGEARISDATSRVIQGILTGIGFLGAGVIVHAEVAGQHKVHGLTSAACVWFTACVGVICGAGEWRLVAVALAVAFVLLIVGGPLERALHRLLSGEKSA